MVKYTLFIRSVYLSMCFCLSCLHFCFGLSVLIGDKVRIQERMVTVTSNETENSMGMGHNKNHLAIIRTPSFNKNHLVLIKKFSRVALKHNTLLVETFAGRNFP